ncbi:Spy/CpxP family protein refolding chaperone [Photobacterium leiognathi]|uniref:Spy/CpxP family protein refolding chaperone n=1 Tax=Photobacterium leiognathi TaxID=553611 RepID=UPI00298170EA|nr:Spy/CpxP family protein refolding chaperone [Photobacterium leiognathi]
MKMFKKTMMMAIAVPMVLGSMSAFAAPNSHGMKGHHGERSLFKQLELTDAQKSEMKALREHNRETMKAERLTNRSEMQANHKALEKLVLADNFDEQAVRQLVERMSEKQAEHRVERLKQRHQMLNILTPAQKVKFAELKQQQAEKHFMKLEKKEQ